MATVQIPLTPMTPDATGNAYAAVVAGTNVRLLVPAFVKDVDASWWFKVRVPQDYNSTPHVLIRVAANSTAGQVSSWIVGSIVRDTTAGWDASALTDETVQDLTMAVVAYEPSDVDFSLSTTPAAGKDLLVRVKHNGTRTQDTLAVDSLLFQAVFQYAT